MKRFKFLAESVTGDTVIREMDAEDEQEVVNRLKQAKLRLITIQTVREIRGRRGGGPPGRASGSSAPLSGWLARLRSPDRIGRVNDISLMLFTQQISTILDAGLNIASGLRVVLISETDDNFRKVIQGLIRALEGGSSAYQAFDKYPQVFSGTYRGLINIGESSSKLPMVLSRHASDLQKLYSFKRRTIASLTYPVITLIFAILSVLLMVIYFVPGFVHMYHQTKMRLPGITRALIFIVRYLTDPLFWIVAIVIILILGFFLYNYVRTPVGKYNFDRIKTAFPLLGDLVINTNLYGIYLNLACMLECGVHIAEALRILRTMTGNEVFRDFLGHTISDLRQGSTLTDSLREQWFDARKGRWFIPRYAVDLVQTGEATGDLAYMVRKAAEMMEENVNQKLETFLSLLEPVIIIFLAFAVGFTMLAIFIPLYNLINSFGS